MKNEVERIAMYAKESISKANNNLYSLIKVQTEITSVKQKISRMHRNSIISKNAILDYETIKLKNELVESEQQLDSIKNTFINNICFAFCYTTELLIIDLGTNSNDIIYFRIKDLFVQIASIMNKLDMGMNLPLYTLIPKIVELETKILLSERNVRYMNLRMIVRDIKAKIEL